MSFQLGLFHLFKGADTLLLSGSPADIADLSARLGEFAASDAPDWPVHSIAHISARNPAQLFASRISQPQATGFVWLCSPESMPAVQGKLQALASSGSGHQYFDLFGSSVQLVVSVGEYSESWWSGGA
ncbi:hypothetical protein GCM10027430_27020 [Lysobacter tyrosinilyticus]